MVKHSLCFGYLPKEEKFEYEGIAFEVVASERAKNLEDGTLWFFDKFQPVNIDIARLEEIGSPTKAMPHMICTTPCIACQGGSPLAMLAQQALQNVKMELDENATIESLLPQHLEVLAMLELLMQLGFKFDQLAFMPSDSDLSVCIHLEDPEIIERMDGDEIYPVKVLDLPVDMDWKPLFLKWPTATVAWKKATAEQRKAVLAHSKVHGRMSAIRDELSKAGILPTPQN